MDNNNELENIFMELRANPSLMLEDWEERIGKLPFSEEIDFLKSIDDNIHSKNR